MFVYVHPHIMLASLHTPWCSGIDCDFIHTCPVSMAEHHQVWWITLQSVCPCHLSCRCRGTVADCINRTHLQVLVHTCPVPICACIHQSCAYMCLYTSVLCLYVLVYISLVPICACIHQSCAYMCSYTSVLCLCVLVYISLMPICVCMHVSRACMHLHVYIYSPVPICAICVSTMPACAYMHVTYLCVLVCVLCLCVLVCCICPVPTCACLYIPSYMRLHAMFV